MMHDPILPILSDPAVAERMSTATRRVLKRRLQPINASERFLAADLYTLLQQVIAAVLPQDVIGTNVDIAAAIDHRLSEGTNAGWRFADLPPDGEAYRQGLSIFARTLDQTSGKVFETMPSLEREAYLRSVVAGDMDEATQFPLSKWLGMLRTDAVKVWLSHPSTMQKLELYGFADGSIGSTNGPTATEGWQAITPNKALPFEQGSVTPVAAEREA
jgi:hypothetical protein